MRTTHDVFHLAIPVHDLDAAHVDLIQADFSSAERQAVEEVAERHPAAADGELHVRHEDLGHVGAGLQLPAVERLRRGRASGR